MMKAAIFDLDGTVLDSMGIWDDAGKRYLRKIHAEPEEDLNRILFPMTMEEGAAYVKKHYGLKQTEPEIVNGVLEIVRDFYYEEVQAKDGVIDFLKELSERRIPMAAATAGDRQLADRALRRLGIRDLFTELLTCSETGAGKHDPDIYLRALEVLGTVSSETYVFEDVFYALETAKKAGFRTVGVADRYSLRERMQIQNTADYFLENWQEAARLLMHRKEE